MKDIFDSKDLTTKYSDMIYHIALRYLTTKDDAEDIVQEVFMKYIAYLRKGKEFNSELHEKCWLIRVTINSCCNEIYSARRRKTLPFKDCLYCEFDVDSENLLYNAVNKLNNRYKEPFMLFHFEDMKISEISEVLRISESNVKTRLKRARDQIREFVMRGERSFERI